VTLQLAENNVAQYIATLPDPTAATSTSVNPALNATKTQPQTLRTAAIGSFIGLVIGITLAFLRDTGSGSGPPAPAAAPVRP
jgi:capsular polysaccharide biosynthesis protein